MDKFHLISPLDFRYMRSDLADKAIAYLSEEAKIKHEIEVEVAYVRALSYFGICKKELYKEIQKAGKKITAELICDEESKTGHETKALVNVLSTNVSSEAKKFIHLGLTSCDVLDTANALRFKRYTEKVLLPEAKSLEKLLIKLAIQNKKTFQIGRTHGQHAEPITFGFFLAQYVSRLGQRILAIENASSNLKGKISGAVGAYNALSLFCNDPLKLEAKTLSYLGLKPSESSTQILPREYFADLVHALLSTLGVIANLADDMRHLQRSEIGEVAEHFGSTQVGSSAMPHKRNPITFENIKSIWKAFSPRILTVYMDQISEHQRDLTNSASERFLPEMLFACTYAIRQMRKALEKLYVDEKAMLNNLSKSSQKTISEALYVLLALQGLENAHEHVRRIAFNLQKGSLIDAALKDKELLPYIKKIPQAKLKYLQNPKNYLGLAEKKTERICKNWEKILGF
ncbi:MAG: lyase family protein [Candidatus Diapherotrites archaeon]|nr:lyase family protein [Candidatus Diapherotrites archaeon]